MRIREIKDYRDKTERERKQEDGNKKNIGLQRQDWKREETRGFHEIRRIKDFWDNIKKERGNKKMGIRRIKDYRDKTEKERK